MESPPSALLDADAKGFRARVVALVRRRQLCLEFGMFNGNPAIKGLPTLSPREQLLELDKQGIAAAWLYPAPALLRKIVPESLYIDRPFTRELALGASQLSFVSFDPGVLESYRHDPRYWYRNNDIGGQIEISPEYWKSREVQARDKVLLKSFGFSYNRRLDRAVAVFRCYLADLSPEHQQLWNARSLAGKYSIHPAYLSWARGDLVRRLSVFRGILAELGYANQVCARAGLQPLFRNDFRAGERPRDLTFLIRSTRREFDLSMLSLDKVLSENLDVSCFSSVDRGDNAGSITLLKRWLVAKGVSEDDADATLRPVREIRTRRQRPAHVAALDKYDRRYFHEQRQLAADVLCGLRRLVDLLAAVTGAHDTVKFPVRQAELLTY